MENNSKNKIKPTLALTGGGTMGHISPNLALLNELRKRFGKIIYIGGKDSMEETQAIKNNLPFYSIETIKFNRKNLFKNLLIPFKVFKAKKQTKKIFASENVDIVFSKGGYVSVPVMLQAQKQKLPNILHESDMTLGLANKVSAKKATQIFVATEKAKEGLSKKLKAKTIVTGIPTSDKFLKTKNNESKQNNLGSSNKEKINTSDFENPTVKKTLLVTGGSQGAKAINQVIRENLESLTKEYNIIHIVGRNNKDESISHTYYKQLEFVFNMPDYMKKADVIISRAGATTIFEALKTETPLIVIPLPKSKSSRGDQVENAKYFHKLGLLEYIEQDHLNLDSLKHALKKISTNSEERNKKIKEFNSKLPSNSEIAELILGSQKTAKF